MMSPRNISVVSPSSMWCFTSSISITSPGSTMRASTIASALTGIPPFAAITTAFSAMPIVTTPIPGCRRFARQNTTR